MGDEVLKVADNGQWSLEKSVKITEHHRKLANILNNYESQGNSHFNHHGLASTFHPHEAQHVVATHEADPDHEHDHTIKTVSGAYHKAIGGDSKLKPSRPIK